MPTRKPPIGGHAKRKMIQDIPSTEFMSIEELSREMDALIQQDKASARRWICDLPDCDGLPHQGWLHRHARSSQRIPEGHWSEWMLLTGRGWGKTKTAAETVRDWAQTPGIQIAVVAKKETLVREICFESPKSGLIAVIPPEEVESYNRTPGAIRLTLKNGTTIFGFGAEVPDNLRGWAFDKAWCDEYAAWNRHSAQETYDMLWFCLREAKDPQVVISTTPKPLPHVKRLLNKAKQQDDDEVPANEAEVRIVRGHTNENRANLSVQALRKLEGDYKGTRLGRQELSGEVLDDVEGALWQGWMFEVEDFRPEPFDVPYCDRKVLAIDPAVTSGEDADMTAFTIMGRSYDFSVTYATGLPHGYVFLSEEHKETPKQAMTRAARMFHDHQCDVVVVEANNGGEYLRTVLNLIDPTVPCEIVSASRDKRARAAPIATLYEQARMHHVGSPAIFDGVEQQMVTYVGIGERDEKSPDLLDSLVWAAFHLFLDPNTPRPVMTGTVVDNRLTKR